MFFASEVKKYRKHRPMYHPSLMRVHTLSLSLSLYSMTKKTNPANVNCVAENHSVMQIPPQAVWRATVRPGHRLDGITTLKLLENHLPRVCLYSQWGAASWPFVVISEPCRRSEFKGKDTLAFLCTLLCLVCNLESNYE